MKSREKEKHSKIKNFFAAIIAIMIFFPFVYAFYKDYKESTTGNNRPSSEQATNNGKVINSIDSVKPSSYCLEYSDGYKEGYEKGYAAGEEDTNDGEYRAGYDDSNPYKGKKALDYCEGYEHGYEDAFEEIIETSDEDGDAGAIW